MRYGKCIICKKVMELIAGKMCALCTEGVKKVFIYSIGGIKVGRKTYNTILKRGYVIPEELEDIRNE